MTVTVKKVEAGKYEVRVNREVIGIAKLNWKDMYVIKLADGREIQAVSQGALKRMIAKYI